MAKNTLKADVAEVVQNTELILSGGPIEILQDNPFAPGEPWFMRQPTDDEYDMSLAIRDASKALALTDPTILKALKLPPSAEWIASQTAALDDTAEKIAEMEARKEELSPVELTLLGMYRDHHENLIKPESYSYGDELVSRTSNKALQNWLIPRLLVDGSGENYLNMHREADQKKWEAVHRTTRAALRAPFYQILNLMSTAKN